MHPIQLSNRTFSERRFVCVLDRRGGGQLPQNLRCAALLHADDDGLDVPLQHHVPQRRVLDRGADVHRLFRNLHLRALARARILPPLQRDRGAPGRAGAKLPVVHPHRRQLDLSIFLSHG